MPEPKYEKPFRDYLRDVGSRIRALRDELGLTTEEAAAAAGMSPGYFGIVERGAKQPSLQSLFGFAKALGVSVADLVGIGIAGQQVIARSRRGRLDQAFEDASPAELKAMVHCCQAILNLRAEKGSPQAQRERK